MHRPLYVRGRKVATMALNIRLAMNAPCYPCSYRVLRKQEICSARQTRSTERSRDVIFSLSISLFFALLAAISAGWRNISLPPYFCATIIQTKTLFIDLAVAVSPPLSSQPVERHLCRHRTTAIAVAVIGPPSGPQHELLPVVRRMGFVGSVLHNHE
jgi:hypothetical protein